MSSSNHSLSLTKTQKQIKEILKDQKAMQISLPPSPVPAPTTSPTDVLTFDQEGSFIHLGPLIMFFIVIFIFIACAIIKLRNFTNEPNHSTSIGPERPESSSSRPCAEPAPTQAIASIVCKYGKPKEAAGWSRGGGGSDCAICLEDFEYGDQCRMFVSCNHGFHRACIDEWLARDSHCPLCRGSIRGVRSVNLDDQV